MAEPLRIVQSDREPLANIEAEAAILGAMLSRNETIDQVADIVSAPDFAEDAHARIFTAIVALSASGQSPNPLTLRPMFDNDEAMKSLGGGGYLAKLTGSVTTLLDVRGNARHIHDLAQRRRLVAALDEARQDALDVSEGLDPAPVIEKLDAALSDCATQQDVLLEMSALQCFDAVMQDQEDISSGVSCPAIARLNRLLGELKPGDFAVLAGRPSMGKTMTGVSYGVGAARAGHGTLFVTLEMSALQIGQRMAADAAFDDPDGVPFNAIIKRKLNEFDRRKMDLVRNEMRDLPLRVVDATGLKIGRLASMVRRQKRRFAAKGKALELVMVDYLQLLHPDRKTDSQYVAISEVSMGLKSLAKKEGVVVIALAQLSRSVEQREDKRPRMSDLRDSGQIEQDADAIALLFRLEYYLQQAEPGPGDPGRIKWDDAMEKARGKIEFIVPKCRNGVTGSAMGEFHANFQAVR